MRGAIPEPGQAGVVQVTANVPNEYNDTIGTFGTIVSTFTASVDPGRHWVLNPMNTMGAANLVNGKWRYKFGNHRGHRAFNQGMAFSVRRDRNRDGRPSPSEPLDTGYFGINLHAGGIGPKVERWSAGCQIIKGGWEDDSPFYKFYDVAQETGQKEFDYWLFDAAELYKFIKKQRAEAEAR